MISSPFLTAVDEARLKIRGSRDPLGLVPLWGRFGRRVVTNLTTASTTVRGFTTLLIGYYFAEETVPTGRERDVLRLRAFLKVEQLAGYARWHMNGDGDFRGISEVRRRLNEENGSIVISGDSAGQILSNQKTYGLWGLYTMPARESAMIARDESILTAAARDFVEREYVSRLEDAAVAERLGQFLKRDGLPLSPAGPDRKVLSALAELLRQKPSNRERRFYRHHLVLADESSRLQREFAEIVENDLPKGEPFSLKHLAEAIKRARAKGLVELAELLSKIRKLEALLVPMSSLFAFVQRRDGTKLSDVASQARKTWGKRLSGVEPAAIDEMGGDIEAVYGDRAAGQRLGALASDLATGRYDAAIERVLEHNAFVMSQRGGTEAWVALSGGRLDVRYRDEGIDALPSTGDLGQAWRDGFYLDPLKSIVDQLAA
jgi:hypothetical protein